MRYLSLFSGIEAASVAWKPLGWECAAVAEIEPFPCAVLAHHYPDVPNLGDVSRIGPEEIAALGRIDLVVFGSPCQDLSIAGKRKGLAGERSGLFHIALDVVRWAREYCGCRWALWENVPGAFSSNKGRDFAAVVEQMAGLDDCPVPPKGWGTEGVAVGDEAMVEWAVLDAQWFGVAQRRRRVFALADFGDWADRPPVLLEPQSLQGHPAPSRGQGPDATGSTGDGVARCLTAGEMKRGDWETCNFVAALTANGVGTCGADDNQAQAGHLLPTAYSIMPMNSGTDYKARETDIAQPVMTTPVGGNQGGDYVVQPMVATFNDDGTARTLTARHDSSPCADRRPDVVAYGFDWQSGGDCRGLDLKPTVQLQAHQTPASLSAMRVRRLTPTECERLQGFPDGWTQVPYRNKPAADGPRYKAIGNSMAVPVMAWIGQRLDIAASGLV